jgi:murein DD-endopeptidase MepM/ murein hydrolase activator NlpD
MFHKDSTVNGGLPEEAEVQRSILSSVMRPSISGPMTMIGVALTFGASVPLLSAQEPVLATDESGTSVATVNSASGDQTDSVGAVAYYTVESGDSLWQIAHHHDANIKALEITNGISANEVLRVGQVLKVPPDNSLSTTSARNTSTPAPGGIGGEFNPTSSSSPISSSSSSLTLGSTEEFSSGWATLDPSVKSTPSQVSPSEISSEHLSGQANVLPAGSKVPSAAVETLVSFSSTGSLVPVTFPEQLSTSPETAWVSASTQSSEPTNRGSIQIALLDPQIDPSNTFQVDQPSPQAEAKFIAADSYAVNREQRIRDSLARIREANTVVIDRDQLASKLASARQQLERSRTQELSSLVGQSDSVNISRSVTSSSSVPSDPNETTGSTASNWVIADVADNLSSTTRLAKADSSSVDEVSISPPSSTDNSQRLLAAAPLNPDIYRPLPSIPSGETIVPGMPMLPGAGEFLPQAPAESNGYVWPTRGTFTSGYGWRWGRMHRGIDIAGPVGTPIVAAASGVVVRSGWNSGGYGNVVDIRHRDGSMTRYAHNSRLLVREGQQVNQGQSIAQMGSTGYSTGPHLHFEIHLPGNGTVNPIAYLPDR